MEGRDCVNFYIGLFVMGQATQQHQKAQLEDIIVIDGIV